MNSKFSSFVMLCFLGTFLLFAGCDSRSGGFIDPSKVYFSEEIVPVTNPCAISGGALVCKNGGSNYSNGELNLAFVEQRKASLIEFAKASTDCEFVSISNIDSNKVGKNISFSNAQEGVVKFINCKPEGKIVGTIFRTDLYSGLTIPVEFSFNTESTELKIMPNFDYIPKKIGDYVYDGVTLGNELDANEYQLYYVGSEGRLRVSFMNSTPSLDTELSKLKVETTKYGKMFNAEDALLWYSRNSNFNLVGIDFAGEIDYNLDISAILNEFPINTDKMK